MDPAVQKMIENLEVKTGKPFQHWIDLVNKSSLTKHGELVKMLKEKHNFGHGYANLVVHTAKKSSARTSSANSDELVNTQYQGKEQLRPIYESLLQKIKKMGPDIEVVPKKNSVSCRRKRQFVLIQPSTKTRIDVGLKFNDRPHEGRLETSGPFGTMCTHRVQLKKISDVDPQLISWVQEAYHEAG